MFRQNTPESSYKKDMGRGIENKFPEEVLKEIALLLSKPQWKPLLKDLVRINAKDEGQYEIAQILQRAFAPENWPEAEKKRTHALQRLNRVLLRLNLWMTEEAKLQRLKTAADFEAGAKRILEEIARTEKPIAVAAPNFDANKITLSQESFKEIPVERANDPDSFLNICSKYTRPKRNHIIVYRGQCNEYILTIDRSISLLPSSARGWTTVRHVWSRPVPPDPASKLWILFWRTVQIKERTETDWRRRQTPYHIKGLMNAVERYTGRYELLSPEHYAVDYFFSVLQHYGTRTLNLDVTLDPKVALWFCTHQHRALSRNKESRQYGSYVVSAKRQGVVYVLEVPSPKLGWGATLHKNVFSADLRAEVPNRSWRPWRQEAVTLMQHYYGVQPGIDLNVFATCIKAKIIVGEWAFAQLEKEGLTLRHLFPDCATDSLYELLVLHEESEVECLIYQDSVNIFDAQDSLKKRWRLFLRQSGLS